MIFEASDDDDLPPIPSSSGPVPTSAAPLNEEHQRRLDLLEAQLHQLRQEMHSQATLQSVPDAAAHSDPSLPQTGGGSTECSSAGPDDRCDEGAAPLRDQEILYELRRLVPNLSPLFACSYNDAVMLVSAIRSGGSGATGTQLSLQDKMTVMESERRAVEGRLEKKKEECSALRADVAQARQQLKAVQLQSKQSVSLLSQKREEMRKQLLTEESRTERMQVRNRKLEKENEDLKTRLRSQIR